MFVIILTKVSMHLFCWDCSCNGNTRWFRILKNHAVRQISSCIYIQIFNQWNRSIIIIMVLKMFEYKYGLSNRLLKGYHNQTNISFWTCIKIFGTFFEGFSLISSYFIANLAKQRVRRSITIWSKLRKLCDHGLFVIDGRLFLRVVLGRIKPLSASIIRR